MWKATATLDQKKMQEITASDDLDWDSDPNFVNTVSEKDQRWGKQKTIVDQSTVEVTDMARTKD
jgi:cortactin